MSLDKKYQLVLGEKEKVIEYIKEYIASSTLKVVVLSPSSDPQEIDGGLCCTPENFREFDGDAIAVLDGEQIGGLQDIIAIFLSPNKNPEETLEGNILEEKRILLSGKLKNSHWHEEFSYVLSRECDCDNAEDYIIVQL